ncbi:hypothetical protein H696_02070 [Fonticula alba]|uniref:Uncharacterized protein n=1 Tax=Fonticula alba TaxID=691883 RepID=A0A058ZA48_FONAL|nr:hypothetical protein H696_02070 [Fonticula alba]KCV71120.1 hypothetical protein H696_02070 [Fonticula alba]|eukprot:XP_009494243.1 hypothetical protein H696_02070 [Fonticula alba]
MSHSSRVDTRALRTELLSSLAGTAMQPVGTASASGSGTGLSDVRDSSLSTAIQLLERYDQSRAVLAQYGSAIEPTPEARQAASALHEAEILLQAYLAAAEEAQSPAPCSS